MFWRKATSALIVVAACCYAAPSFAVSGDNFTQITGETENEYLADSLATGDFNGDGFQDVVAGARNAQSDGVYTGAIHIFYGSTELISAGNASTLADATYVGEHEYDWSGYSLSSGDFNGDGYDDILIGSLFYTAESGSTGGAYLIYGQADQLPGGSLSGEILFTGENALDEFGYKVGNVGDLNADGYDDMMFGAPANDGNGVNSGTVYLVYGQEDHFTSGDIGTVATRIVGDSANDNLGFLTAPAGDINNDGYDDAVIGAGGVDSPATNAGAVYIVYGQADAYPTSSTASDFVELTGEATNDQLGYSGHGVGDIDNDGFDDLVIGSPYYGEGDSGAIYVFYGSDTELTDGSITQGARLTDSVDGNEFGYVVAPGGDIDGGGAEFYVSSPYDSTVGENSGVLNLFWTAGERYTDGSYTRYTYLNFLAADASESFGTAVVSADVNDDGYNDVWVAASTNSDGASNAGALYVGYIALDFDKDGSLGSNGIGLTSDDCNDNDASVSYNHIYYLDDDADGLGDPSTETGLCLASAPEGYAENALDTNDTVRNNNVEISGDSVDNDNDGSVDEVNTLAENGAHPEYSTMDPLNNDAIAAAIVKVSSTKKGKVRVQYADNSVYVYTVFSGTSHGKAVLKQYGDTGYYAVLKHNGRKLVIVNVLNGARVTSTRTIAGVYTHNAIQFTELRSSTHPDVVITSKNGDDVRLYAAEMNLTAQKLKHNVVANTTVAGVNIHKTNIVGNTIDLRSKTTPLASFLLNKAYQLVRL